MSFWTSYGFFLVIAVGLIVITAGIDRLRRRRVVRAAGRDVENPPEVRRYVIGTGRATDEEAAERDDVYLDDPSLAALQQRLKSRRGGNDPEIQKMISEALFEASAPVPTDCKDMVCSICLDDIANDKPLFSSQTCNHTFHSKCIEQWIYKAASLRCPNCNQEFDKAPEQKHAPFASNLVEPVA